MYHTKIIAFLFVIFSTLELKSQPVYFQKIFGDSLSICVGKSVVQGNDGSLYYTGNYSNFSIGQQGIEFIKLDSNGNVLWQKILSTGTYYANRSMLTPLQTILITGQFTDSAGNTDALAMNIDTSGNFIFNRTYGNLTSTDVFQGLNTCSDGGFIFTGFTTNPSGPGNAFWMLKTDSAGNEQWQQTYNYNVNSTSDDIIQTNDGGYIMSGDKKTVTANYNSHVIKTDSAGYIQWETAIANIYNSGCKNMIRNKDGNFVIIGESATATSAYFDPYITLIDTGGNILWSHAIICSNNPDAGYDIIQNADGNYLVTGFGYDTSVASTELLIMQLDTAGYEISRKYFGSNGYDQGFSIIHDYDGTGFYTAGMITINSNPKYLLVHDYLPVISNLTESENITPAFSLYPQPADDIVNINQGVLFESGVIKIYNMMGKVVFVKPITNSENSIDTSTLPQGVYVAEFNNKAQVQRSKLLIVH